MAVNTSHANNGVLLHAGESILLFCDNVTMSFSGQSGAMFSGDKSGRLYLTTHRMIFNNKKQSDGLKSFSFPFVALRDVELEQPIFGSNYIKGRVIAQPNGNFSGEARFKLYFKSGGAIDFGQAMLRAAQMASRHSNNSDAPPAYTAPTSPWYAAPPPAYTANPGGYQGWVPPTNVFPDHPPANTVYMTDAPPPYPGISGYAPGAYAPASTAYQRPAAANGAAGAAIGAGGFVSASAPPPSGADAKAAEAAASGGQVRTGYYDPTNSGTAFVPTDLPPSYNDSEKKND